MSLEYRFDYVRGDLGEAGPEIADLATKRGAEGWRLTSVVNTSMAWALFFERRLLSREEHLVPPHRRERGHRRVDPAYWRDGSSIADAPPLEVPSLLAQRREEWEERYADPTAAEYRLMIRELDARVATLLEIIRRRDEVITLARRFKGWTSQSKHYIEDEDVQPMLAALDRLDEEEKPR